MGIVYKIQGGIHRGLLVLMCVVVGNLRMGRKYMYELKFVYV